MKKRPEFRLAEGGVLDGGATGPDVPVRYPSLADAGPILGLSGAALRKKFERGDLPRELLLRIGPRTLRVDIRGLLLHLKTQAGQRSA